MDAVQKDDDMLVFLNTLHFISLWAAGGLGVGGWVLQYVHKRNQQRPSVEVVQSLRLMGLLALIAVLTLWVTGYLLSGIIYGGLPTSGAFHAKLFGAALILICSLGANLETLRSMRAGTPPRVGLMTIYVWTVRISLLVVLSGAAAAFSDT